tara:strand:- start:53345 stop:53638 length:294 start_codon:yes stop_codon:yes gene_type:complete
VTDFNALVTEAARLAILQVLEQDADYSHNQNILQMILESLGHGLSSDRIRTELRWLEEQGLISIESVSSLLVAKLNQRGLDVAKGRSRVDGVARPRP